MLFWNWRSVVRGIVAPILITIHWVLTRGVALALIGAFAWYYPRQFNQVYGVLEDGVQWALDAMNTNNVIKLLIIQSKPEFILLFITLLIFLYWTFSFILWPLRSAIWRRTTVMVIVHIGAFIGLYALAYLYSDGFGWLLAKAIDLRDVVFDWMGSSDRAEEIKAFVRLMHPRSIFLILFAALILKLLTLTPQLPGAIRRARQRRAERQATDQPQTETAPERAADIPAAMPQLPSTAKHDTSPPASAEPEPAALPPAALAHASSAPDQSEPGKHRPADSSRQTNRMNNHEIDPDEIGQLALRQTGIQPLKS